VQAEEDKTLLPMITCQESWLDWKQDTDRGKQFADVLESKFRQDTRENSFIPNQTISILGHNVSRVYPTSVGMALGFSVVVDGSFETVKTSLEQQTGKSFTQCETENNSKSCEYKLAKNKTIVLMADGTKGQVLFGCYYYYQQ
jgi:hypothetical protein